MVFSHSIIPSTETHMKAGQIKNKTLAHVNVTLSFSTRAHSPRSVRHSARYKDVTYLQTFVPVFATQLLNKRRPSVRLSTGRFITVINPVVVAVGFPIGNPIVISVREPNGVEILGKHFPINWMRQQ